MGSAQCLSSAPCCQEGKHEAQQQADSSQRSADWSEEAVSRSPLPLKSVGARPVMQDCKGDPPPPYGGQDVEQWDQPPMSARGMDVAGAPWPTPGGTNPQGEFLISLERSASDIIGINLDVVDEVSLVVVGIMPGAVKAWNEAHLGAPVLQMHDRIVEANGVRGAARDLLAELKRSMKWSLSVVRPVELRVALDRASLVARGRDLKYAASSTSLLISEIEGAFAQWNRRTTGPKISKFDRIVEMNGVRGSAQELLHSASFDREFLDVVILHYVS